MDLKLLNALQAAPPKAQGAQDQAQLREAARQFEALFVKQLLAQVDVAGGLSGGENAQSDFVNSMWRDKLSQQMTEGQGLGLAQMLVRQLGGDAQPVVQRQAVSLAGSRVDRAQAAVYQAYAGEPAQFESRREFVTHLKPHLEQAAAELGVSPKVLLAQAALETGWGQRLPQSNEGGASRNLFGIKADRGWQGDAVSSRTAEYFAGERQQVQADFRQYPSFAESVRDYVSFLKSNPRYEPALQHGGSDKNFLQGLKSAGYATDPYYVDKVIAVADSPSMTRYWNEI